jgi:hypothetical protein
MRRQTFLGSERLASANTAKSIFLSLVRVTVLPLLLALGTATALLLGELYLPDSRWSRLLPFPLWHLDDRDSYASFLSTISGIGGVLIALYYTGMAAVGSAVYARAPGVLRNLLLREPIGKFYMQLVAYTTFVSLCLLAFHAIGFSPIRFAFPFLILLSGVTILSFVQLGQQAFHFFDPTSLSDSLFIDLDQCVRRVTVAGSFWEDNAFQKHASQGAASALKSLATLVNYSASTKHLKSDAIAGVAVSTIRFLYRYEASRRLIPSQSKWYPSEYKHPDVYLAGELKVEFALRSGASVQPENVAQENWIEDASLKLVLQALESNLREEDESGVFKILNHLQLYIERLGELWEVDASLNLASKIGEILQPFLRSPQLGSVPLPRWRIGLAEYLCLLPTSILLGFVKSLDGAPLAKLRDSLARVRWERPATLYRSGFQRLALPSLEWFQSRMAFEHLAEREGVTPNWFVEQVLARDHLKVLQAALDLLLGANDRLFGDWRSKLEAAKNPWAAAISVNRQGEYIRKTLAHFDKFVAEETDYENAKVMHDLRGWPTGKNEAFNERIAKIQQEYRIVVATWACTLVGTERPSHLPDYGGEFLLQTAQTLTEAIFQDDSDTFKSVFPSFFQASIKEVLSLLKIDAGQGDREQFEAFALATAPFLDLVEITGYAILASELRQQEGPWSAAQATWYQYLTAEEEGPVRVGVVNDALKVVNFPGTMAPGETIRTGWRTQALEWVMRSVGLDPSSAWPFFGDGSERQSVRHPSAVIRAFVRETFPGMYRGIDVFAAAFFLNLPGAESPGRGFRFSGFADALRRETNRPQSEDFEDGEDPEDEEPTPY